jgi:hypothetical protein
LSTATSEYVRPLTARIPEITRTLEILHGESKCYEIRILDIPGYRGRLFNAAGYFNSISKAAHAAAVFSDKGAVGVYVTLNPTNPALLARSENRVKDHLKPTTADAEITRRRWLIIDIDPTRPAGVSATDEEQQTALALAHDCEQFLTGKGWPLPVIGSSGNGYALFFPIDLPNDDESNNLVANVLKAVDQEMRRRCGDSAHVDPVVFNAARIVRLFGTANRKGDSTTDRPHRMAELFDPPDPLEVVSVELLRAVAGLAPATTAMNGHAAYNAQRPATHSGSRPRLDMSRYLADRGLPFQLNKTSDGRARFQIKTCVFDESHNGTSACFMQDQAGKPSYKCFHSSCASRGWQQAKQAIGPPTPDHYDPPLGVRMQTAAGGILPTGTKVKASDRDNFGEVLEDHGRTVTVHFVSPEGQQADVDLPKSQLVLANGTPASGGGYWPQFLTSAQFDAGDYGQRFLVKRVLVAGQHGIIGGRYKTMKTSVGVDLVVSVGTGTPFLGHFETVRSRVGMLSGESGQYTLRETARRVAAARGRALPEVDAIWDFDLPQIARAADLESLAEAIELHGIELLVIDPAYLCLLGGDTQGKQASNLFDMGPILLGLSDVAKWTDSTIVLLHHCRKNTADIFAPPELDELSMAGFAEWARQWILLGRREPYEQDSGLHKLWLNVGGSAGHSGCWAVDVNEGVLGDDFSGRKWDVEVKHTGDARKEAAQQRARTRAEQQGCKEAEYRRRLIETLLKFPAGESSRVLRTTSGLNPDNFGIAIRSILADGKAMVCEVVKGRRTYEGYRPTGK